MSKAIILFSGGQDSTTCLYWAMKKYNEVLPITFDYGQKHSIEIDCAKQVLTMESLKSIQQKITIPNYDKQSALLKGNVTKIKEGENGNPASTFVEGRNHLFISYAAIIAKQLNISDIITGVCQTDYSGYPDCRDNFIKSLQVTLSLAMQYDFNLITPLMYLTKAQTWELANSLGNSCIEKIIKFSHTCYNGNRETLHEWGYGCNNCPACLIRAKGFKEFFKL